MIHLEGRLSVRAAIETGRRKVDSVLVGEGASEEKLEDVLAAAKRKGIPVRRVPTSTLEEIVHGKTHGWIVAMCSERTPDPESALDPILAGREPPFLLLLEGVDDARNFGATLRTAEALGVHAVILKKREWDFDETAVMRASSGAFERLTVVKTQREDGLLERLKARGLAIWACIANARRSIYEADFRTPMILAVGGEKRGLSGAARSICTGLLKIPTKPGATSLTMSHAAAILMAEAARQRA